MGLTNVQISERLLKEGLDDLGAWYLDEIRAEDKTPRSFRPYDKRHQSSQRWLLQTGLYELYHPERDMKEAQRLLSIPRAKEFVEAMLAANAPLEAVQESLPRYTHSPTTVAALERYRYFFWNIELLNSVQLRALLHLRLERLANHMDPQVAAQAGPMKKASHTDPVRFAANLPFNPMSAVAAQMRLGVTARNIQIGKVLDAIQQAAAIKAYETLHFSSGPMAAMDAKTYLDMVRTAIEARDLLNDPDQRVYERLQLVALETEKRPSLTMHELTGGNHTTDFGPRSDPKEDENGTE